ncbi:MAG: nitrite reductase, copper-containing [Deltaproteobacteria bacterium]|nr:MAG: nitrite reductase, copper-containing [Deltaproteobacteria bacterium]
MLNLRLITTSLFIFSLLITGSVLSQYSNAAGLEGYEIGVQADVDNLPRIKQKLVSPPFVPDHEQVAIGGPKIVEVEFIIEEKEIEVAPDAFIQAMTFNGSVPGPLIIVHEGDYVELTLVNPKTNTLLHNIDFHASTGALGAGELTKVSPGQQVKVRFKATRPGVFIYHCAPGGVMIPWHVVSGMNGAIMVLPREGLKDENGNPVKYDKAYYIGEQDYYLPQGEDGNYIRFNSPLEGFGKTVELMKGLIPTHEVFNGKVGALTGENALTANVGETVLFIHSQANRQSNPHLIGGHGDLVWERGSFNDKPQTNLETWLIAAGSAGAMLYTFQQPGLYVYLNHNLIEAILLGAAAHVKVDGKWNNDLMEQTMKPTKIKE